MKLPIFSFLILICLSSCTRTVSLGYAPVIEMQKENHIAMKVDNFEDSRSKKSQQVGALRNGYGMPIVKLVTDENIPCAADNSLDKKTISLS